MQQQKQPQKSKQKNWKLNKNRKSFWKSLLLCPTESLRFSTHQNLKKLKVWAVKKFLSIKKVRIPE